MTGFGLFPILFLDVEASGLLPGCFPVEVGWAASDEPDLTGSLLIRPAPIWTYCDPNAEAMHGLSLPQLIVEGLPVEEVAARLLDVARGRTLVSDSPGWDGGWLEELLAEARSDALLPLVSFPDLLDRLAAELEDKAPAMMTTALAHAGVREAIGRAAGAAMAAHPESRHRAGPDARRIRAGWERALAQAAAIRRDWEDGR